MGRLTVEEMLRRRIGLDPASTGPGLVARGARTRMKALGIDETDFEKYEALLSRSPREVEALVEEVVVPESWFFRDEHPFALLAERAAAGWLVDPARHPLRALSLPCAGGEEPYSIAIALIDRGLPASRFQVDGVDVSRSVLEVARRGLYSANAFRSGDLSFRDRHFRPTAAGYELSDAIKSSVEFRPGNLLDRDLLADRPPYDVIFCRNLLIYLDADARKLALANLERLLGPAGLLFLGHAEQLGLLSPRFQRASDRRCFAFERRPAQTVGESRATVPPKPHPPKAVNRKSVLPAASLPRPVVPAPPTPESQTTTDAIAEATRLADLGRHAEAARLCQQAIRQKGPTASALFLLGVVHQATGERDQAERCFEKVIYLDPDHHEALLNLALIVQRRGDTAAAAGYRRRAERASREGPAR